MRAAGVVVCRGRLQRLDDRGLRRRCEGCLRLVDGLVEHEVDVGGVVDELAVLDVLAEAGVGDGGDEGQHRSEQVGGSFGFAARYGPLPGVGEPAAGQCMVGGRQRSGEGQRVAEWVGEAGVAPVDDDVVGGGAVDGAGMEVAVGERLGYSAVGDRSAASVEVVDEAGQGAWVGVGEVGESVGDQLLDVGWEEVQWAVWQSEPQQVIRSVDPCSSVRRSTTGAGAVLRCRSCRRAGQP